MAASRASWVDADILEFGKSKGALHSVDDQKQNVQHRCSTAGLDPRKLLQYSTNKRLRPLSDLYIGVSSILSRAITLKCNPVYLRVRAAVPFHSDLLSMLSSADHHKS